MVRSSPSRYILLRSDTRCDTQALVRSSVCFSQTYRDPRLSMSLPFVRSSVCFSQTYRDPFSLPSESISIQTSFLRSLDVTYPKRWVLVLSDRVIPSRYILLSLDTRCDTTLVTLYSLSDRVIRWKRIVSRSPFTQPSGSISISSYRRTLDVTPLLWHSTRCQIEWSAAKRIVSRSRSGQKKIAPKSDLIQYKVNDRLS